MTEEEEPDVTTPTVVPHTMWRIGCADCGEVLRLDGQPWFDTAREAMLAAEGEGWTVDRLTFTAMCDTCPSPDSDELRAPIGPTGRLSDLFPSPRIERSTIERSAIEYGFGGRRNLPVKGAPQA